VPPVPAEGWHTILPPRVLLEPQTGWTQFDSDQVREAAREAAEQAREAAREAAEQAREQNREISRQAAEQARIQADIARQQAANLNLNLNFDYAFNGQKYALFAQNYSFRGTDGQMYSRGMSALDSHRYDQALDEFNAVAARGGTHAEGALYWKAYTLNKLGRRDEALATIETLRKSYPNSRWLDDAKALELEVKQAAGKPVSPETESDDDLKILALNGLAQSDPDRAFPMLEKIIKGPQSPALKRRALYVLAQNSSPRAQQLLEQVARGNGVNPDLQVIAISYLFQNRRQNPNRGQILQEIYGSSNDLAVKRAVLNAFESNQDYDHLAQIARTEKDKELRESALHNLGNKTGQPELWQIYQTETTPEGKQMILQCMYDNGNTEKLTEVARTEKDPAVRATAIEVLARQKAATTPDTLVSLYTPDLDRTVKRSIVNSLANQKNARAVVVIYRKENTLEMKKYILDRLNNMRSPESIQLLEEILNK
jgi:hypothetical protein